METNRKVKNNAGEEEAMMAMIGVEEDREEKWSLKKNTHKIAKKKMLW